MNDQRAVLNKGQKVLHNGVKTGVLRQEFRAKTVDLKGFLGDVALRIDISMKNVARRCATINLDGANFNNAMPRIGRKPRCFRIQNNFARHNLCDKKKALCDCTVDAFPPSRGAVQVGCVGIVQKYASGGWFGLGTFIPLGKGFLDHEAT